MLETVDDAVVNVSGSDKFSGVFNGLQAITHGHRVVDDVKHWQIVITVTKGIGGNVLKFWPGQQRANPRFFGDTGSDNVNTVRGLSKEGQFVFKAISVVLVIFIRGNDQHHMNGIELPESRVNNGDGAIDVVINFF